MKSFVAALAFMAGIFPTIVADVEIPDLRYLQAYTEYSYEGPFEYFVDYVPDLNAYSIDNAIKSICFTGFWLLYSEINYEGTYLGYYHEIDYCRNLTSSSYMDEASSLRYAGSPYGLNDVYYNLYEGTSLTGAEFKGNTNAETVGALDQDVSSLVITGQSPWTFFTGLQHTGVAVCVYPTETAYGDNGLEMDVYHALSMSSLDLPDNSIRSVAKGCLSEKIVRLPPSEASLHQKGDHKLTNNAH